MGKQLLINMVTALMSAVTPELLKDGIAAFLDAIEDKVLDTGTKWDDIVILPVINALRGALDIEDEEIE